MWAGPSRFVQVGARWRDVASSSEHAANASAACSGLGHRRTANCAAASATGWGNLSAAETRNIAAGHCEAARGETGSECRYGTIFATIARFADWAAFAACAGRSDFG